MTDQLTAPSPAARWPRVAAVLAALLLLNLAVYAIGRALGGAFTYRQDGADVEVGPGAVTLMTLGPLSTGLLLVAALGRRWPRMHLAARIAVPVLAVATIAVMTLPAGFDTTSAVSLAAMHLALVPAAYLALNLIRRDRS